MLARPASKRSTQSPPRPPSEHNYSSTNRGTPCTVPGQNHLSVIAFPLFPSVSFVLSTGEKIERAPHLALCPASRARRDRSGTPTMASDDENPSKRVEDLKQQATYLHRLLHAVSMRPRIDDEVRAAVIEALAEVEDILHCLDTRTTIDRRVNMSAVEQATRVESQRLQDLVRSTLGGTSTIHTRATRE